MIVATAGVRSYAKKDGTRVSSHSRGYQAGTLRSQGQRTATGVVQLAGAGVFAVVAAVELVTSVLGLAAAVVTVTTAVLLSLLGVRARHKRRRTTRKAPTRGRAAVPPVRRVEAKTQRKVTLREQRWHRRDEVWHRRWESFTAWWSRRRDARSAS